MRTLKHVALAATAAAALALAGCGGGGSGPSGAGDTKPPPGTALAYSALQAGTEIAAGTYHVTGAPADFDDAVTSFNQPTGGYAPGSIVPLGALFIGCTGSADCSITDNDDGSFTTTGTIVVGSTYAAVDDDVQTGLPTPPPTRAETVAKLYADTAKATMNAIAAGTAASTAEKNATTNSGKLGVIATMGESKTAMDNAQAVLDAKTAAGKAVTDAEAAQTAAEAAKTAATALSDGADKTDLLAAIEVAITEAKAQVTAAKAVNTGTKLRDAVRAVTGTSTTNPKTPVKIGEGVADMVDTLLTVNDSDNTGTDQILRQQTADNQANNIPNTFVVPTKATTTNTKPVVMNSKAGMTFADIVGASSLVDQTTVLSRDGTPVLRTVPSMPVAGMMTSKFVSTAPTGVALNKNAQTDNAAYLGIGGELFCAGSDCKVTTAGAFAGSWYFVPDYPKAFYTATADGSAYSAETYAQFGHWLDMWDNDNDSTTAAVLRVTTFAEIYGEDGQDDAGSGTAGLGNITGKNTATYTGTAAGMSVHKTFDADDQQIAIASGAFTADVTLDATFGGDTQSLKGEVSNFVGNAVDSAWKVKLEGASDGSAAAFNTAVSVAA